MFNFCKWFKCKKKSSKIKSTKIKLEAEKIITYVQKEYGLRVYLNIYHLTYFNYLLQFFGFGIFHTSLEINDNEYSFNMGVNDESGIFINNYKDGMEKKLLKEKIYLGNTPYDINSINEIFKLYIPFWLGNSYNLFEKNCNDFTKFFAGILLRTDYVINFPDYVNRITVFAQYFNIFYHPIKKLYFDNNSNPSSNSSSLSTESLNNENNKDNSNNKEDNNNENNNDNTNKEENNNINDNRDDIRINKDNNNKKENSKISIKSKDKNIYNKENIKEAKNEIKKDKENNGG